MMRFPEIVTTGPEETVVVLVISHKLEPVAIESGVITYRRVDLPKGNVQVVFSRTVYLKRYVWDKIEKELKNSLYCPLQRLQVSRIQSSLRLVLDQAVLTRDLSFYEGDRTFCVAIQGSPEYFKEERNEELS